MMYVIFRKKNPELLLARVSLYGDGRMLIDAMIEKGDTDVVLFNLVDWKVDYDKAKRDAYRARIAARAD